MAERSRIPAATTATSEADPPPDAPRGLRLPERRTFRLSDLLASEYNPRTISPAERAQLERSLDEFGLVQDLVVNVHPERFGVVVGGHRRLEVALARGVAELPAVVVSLPIERERELNVRLNHDGGRFDPDLLALHFERGELAGWGFNDEELADFDAAARRAGADASALAPPAEFPPVNDPPALAHRCPRCQFEFD